jgi:flagellar basal-body rod protein FlgB
VGIFDVTQSVLQEAMSGAALREQVLANNVANANTPGFSRSDLDFQSAIRDALASGTPLDQIQLQPQVDSSAPLTLDGNNVSIDAEMSRLSENTILYQSLSSIAKARLKMIEEAVKPS